VVQPLLVMRLDLVVSNKICSKGAVASVKTRAKNNARNSSTVVPACAEQCHKVPWPVPGAGSCGSDSRFVHQTLRKARQFRALKERLVGIEPNPGPKGKGSAKTQKRGKRASGPIRANKSSSRANAKRRMGVPMSMGPASRNRRGATSRLQKSLVVTESEYVGDITLTSAGFVNTQYSINPGDSTMFPWLSSIAANFNKYQFRKLGFRYEPIASGYATAGQSGHVILSVNPDASDAAPVAQAQVYDLQMKCARMPCDENELSQLQPSGDESSNRLSLAELNKQDSYYVRVGAAPANTDIKTYDCGKLNVSTIGTATSGTSGKLFVDYSVYLHSPVLVQPASGGVLHFSSITGVSADNLAGMALQAGGTPALGGISAAGNTISFPAGVPGNYLVVLTIAGATSCGALSANSITGGTTAGPNLLTGSGARDAVGTTASLAGTTTAAATYMTVLTQSAAAGTLVMAPATIVGTASADLFIILLPSAVLTLSRHSADERLGRLEQLFSQALLRPRCASVITAEELSDDECITPPSAAPLSSSTVLDVIGELMSRKSGSNKKN